MLKIEIKTSGAAYSEEDEITEEGRCELYRNLKNIGATIANTDKTEGTIMDVNGNKVGKWTLE